MRHLNRKAKRICMSVLSAIAGVSVAGCGGGGGARVIPEPQPPMYAPPPAPISSQAMQTNRTQVAVQEQAETVLQPKNDSAQ